MTEDLAGAPATPRAERWVITGGGGMLATDVVEKLAGKEITVLTRAQLDITDSTAVRDAIAGHDVVVNCAAYTAVDDAESAEADAFAVNAIGPANLARACRATSARLVHVSTDYVFAGDATDPYPETAAAAPRSAYGRTKAAGEWAVRAELPDRAWIVRTAWLYGASGPNFVKTMLTLEQKRDTVEVVDDQLGQPTWSADVAAQILALVDAGAAAGIYHATSTGQTTWHGFTQEIYRRLGADPERVRRTTSAAFSRPAPRPAYSVLGHDAWAAAGLDPLPPWQDALAAAFPSVRAAMDQAASDR